MNVKRIGVDLAKNVFELYGVDEREQRVLSKTVRRGQLLATFAQLPPSCGHTRTTPVLYSIWAYAAGAA